MTKDNSSHDCSNAGPQILGGRHPAVAVIGDVVYSALNSGIDNAGKQIGAALRSSCVLSTQTYLLKYCLKSLAPLNPRPWPVYREGFLNLKFPMV
jgi:hypothetical protein